MGLEAKGGVLASEELPELPARPQALGPGLRELPVLGVAGLGELADHLGGLQLGEAVAGPLPAAANLGRGPLGAEIDEPAGMRLPGQVVLHPALGNVGDELVHTEQARRGEMVKGVFERPALAPTCGSARGGRGGIPGDGRGLGNVAGGAETGDPFHAAPSFCQGTAQLVGVRRSISGYCPPIGKLCR